MKTLKNYNQFSDDRLNEGFLDVLKAGWKSLIKFLKEKFNVHAWYYYMVYGAKHQLFKKNSEGKNYFEFYVPNLKGFSEGFLETEDFEEIEALKKEKFTVTYGIKNKLNEVQVQLKDDKLENVEVDELKDIIKEAYQMNLQRVESGEGRERVQSLFIWGAPGIGKTSILKQVAKELDIAIEIYHLASTDPTDFRGVPTIENIEPGSTDPTHERTVNKLPAVFPTSNCPNGKGGIFFFDEFNQARQAILSAALPLVSEGEFGTYKLPSHWIIVAAGNRQVDLGGGGTDLQAPMSNRFTHFNYAPSVQKDFFRYCSKNQKMNPDIIGFLLFKPEYFHMLDPEKEVQAWPSPRSWEKASELDYFKRGGDWSRKLPRETIRRVYAANIGQEAASSFVEFLDLKEHFNDKDVKDVFTKGKEARKLPNRLDQSYAAIGSIASYKKGEKLTEQELTNALDYSIYYLESKDDKSFEKITPLISLLNFLHPECKQDPKLFKIYMEFIKRWHLSMNTETGLYEKQPN